MMFDARSRNVSDCAPVHSLTFGTESAGKDLVDRCPGAADHLCDVSGAHAAAYQRDNLPIARPLAPERDLTPPHRHNARRRELVAVLKAQQARSTLSDAFLGTDAEVKGCLWAVPAVRPALSAAVRSARSRCSRPTLANR
jgi:hypothetical protein